MILCPRRPAPIRLAATWRLPALLLPLLLCAGAPASEPSEHDMPAVDAVAKVVPAVVNVSVWREVSHGPAGAERLPAPTTRERSFGSGFVIDPSGILVTNKHVVEGADTITVGFEGDRRYPARVLASAITIDLALLKIDVDHPLPVVQFGDSDDLRVGEAVLAIGNPLSVGISVTSGVVSALNRDIHDTPFDDYIQTDASTNPGSSGGPLIDLKGRVIGIDTAYLTGNGGKSEGSIGIAFAMPSSGAQFVISQLLKYGSVRAGWLGMQVQTVTPEMAAALGMPEGMGQDSAPCLAVTSVEPDLPAAKAGVAAGDVITAFQGKSLPGPRALMRAIGRTEIGTSVTLDLWRAGGAVRQQVVVEEWPAEHAPPRKPSSATLREASLGLSLQPVLHTVDGGVMPTEGVRVIGVDHESEAMYAGIEIGDVIMKVLREDVTSPRAVFAAIDAARKAGGKYVSLLIRRGGVPRWTTLPL